MRNILETRNKKNQTESKEISDRQLFFVSVSKQDNKFYKILTVIHAIKLSLAITFRLFHLRFLSF